MNAFHLALEGGDLGITLPFYTDILGCERGPGEEGLWQDVDFWGHELTLHRTEPRHHENKSHRERHKVETGLVCVPHFGIHLAFSEWEIIRQAVHNSYGYLDTPITRFKGTEYQQETFFIEDPNFNVIEIKTIPGTLITMQQQTAVFNDNEQQI